MTISHTRLPLVLDWDGTVTERDTLHMVIERYGDFGVFAALEEEVGGRMSLDEVIALEMATITAPLEEVVDFGEYYFLSRVVHPLLVAPAEPAFAGRLNEIARELWRSGVARGRFRDSSTLVLYVCRKP